MNALCYKFLFVPFVFAIALAQDTSDPPELTALRSQYEQRLEKTLKPFRDRFVREMEALTRRLLQTQRYAEALTVQRYSDQVARTGLIQELPENAPLDLTALHTIYKTHSENASRPLITTYLEQLNALQSEYSRKGNVEASFRVAEEIERIKPTSTSKEQFNWRREAGQVRYQYEHDNFLRGMFDYSDADCIKLTDGKIGDRQSEFTVGWRDTPPPRIRIAFSRSVWPRAFKIYMHGGGHLGVHVSPEIRVLAGSQLSKAALVGQARQPDDRTGWVVVKLKLTSPEQFFWIEIAPPSNRVVQIDEIEFE